MTTSHIATLGRYATAGLLIFLAFNVNVTAKLGSTPAPDLAELALRILFGVWLVVAAHLIVARRQA